MRKTRLAAGGALLAGVALAVGLSMGPAGSSTADIRIDKEKGTIQQDLPDLSNEPHDEAALRAEGARLEACLESHGMTDVVQTFNFEGAHVGHYLSYKPAEPGMSAEDRNAIDLECQARITVLISDFEPKGTK